MSDFEKWLETCYKHLLQTETISKAVQELVKSVALSAWESGYQKAKEDILKGKK